MRSQARARLGRLVVVGSMVLSVGVVASPAATGVAAAAPAPAPADFGNPLFTGATRVGDAPDTHTLSVFAGLAGDDAGLAAFAASVSDPSQPTYGGYLSVPALAARFGPTASQRATLDQTVAAAGGSVAVDVTGAFATISVTPSEAATLFGTTFGLYEGGGAQAIAPDAMPTLTPALDGIVDYVRGLDLVVAEPAPTPGPPPAPAPPWPPATSPAAGGTLHRTGTPSGCAESQALSAHGFEFGLAPNQLLTAYGIDDLHAAGTTGDGVRLALVEQAPFAQSDLAAFKACFGITSPAPIEHGTAPVGDAGSEAVMDVEILSAVVPDAERIDVFYNPFVIEEPWTMAPFLSAPLDAAPMGGSLPDVVSVSYGACEAAVTHYGGANVYPIVEQVLATGAAAGVSYVVATGDSGASSCLHNGIADPAASVGYPASSAWVTAVGGTSLTLDANNTIAGQGVWNDEQYWPAPATPPGPAADSAGTGGTSTAIARPAWQSGPAVPAGTMRTVPDVAYFADPLPGYILYCTTASSPGECGPSGWTAIGGTSAATPLFAGSLALLTQQARAAGQLDLGFAAPLVYRLAADTSQAAPLFFDVTLGSNDVAGVGCCAAAPGYDLASGWGSLDVSHFAAALGTPTLAVTAGAVSAEGLATLTADATLPAGTVVEYAWDTTGDGVVDATSTEPTVTAFLGGAGAHPVIVAVRTSLGRIGAGATIVEVAGHGGGSTPARPVRARPQFTG